MRTQDTDEEALPASDKVSLAILLNLALPALGVLSATPLFLLLDTSVVGHTGALNLAALGAGTTVYSQVTTQLTFLSYGTTARSSRLFGAGRRSAAIAEGVQATWVALSVGIVLCAIVFFNARRFAWWLSSDPQVADAASHWLRMTAFGIPLVLIEMAGNGWLRGIQNTRLPLVFTLAGVIPGAIAIPIFVAKWGLVGSAAANLMGTVITATLFAGCLAKFHEGPWKPSWSVIREQLKLGSNLILRSLSFQVSFVSAAAVASRFGAASLAGHQVMLQLWNFLTLVLDSLAIAAQTLTGAALGAGAVARARAVGLKVVAYSSGVAVVLALVFAAGYRIIPRAFTRDEEVVGAMAHPWWLLIALIVVGGVVFALDGVLLGAGDAAFLRNISMASALCGFLPFVWLSLVFGWGLTGVWVGLFVFVVLRLSGVVYRFQSMKWAATS